MYKEKKFFGLLALLLMGCGSMVAQSKLAPMVSAYVQQAKTRRAASAEEQKPTTAMASSLESLTPVSIAPTPSSKTRMVTYASRLSICPA